MHAGVRIPMQGIDALIRRYIWWPSNTSDCAPAAKRSRGIALIGPPAVHARSNRGLCAGQ